MSERFLVMGATGTIGRRVLDLLQRAGQEVRGASRHPIGEGWVRFDLVDPATHGPALEGISTAMLVARPGDEEADRFAAPLIETMRRHRVGRVVVLSALGAAARPDFSLRKVELLVEQSGLAWTHVRPNFFMEVLARPPLSTEIAHCGTLSLPLGEARVAYVAADDVAAVLARALVDPSLVGTGIELSGPESLTHAELVDRISQQINRPLRYVDLDAASARRLLAERGFPPVHIERLMGFYSLIRKGWCAKPDTGAAQLLGRPLIPFSDFAARNAAAWQAGKTERRQAEAE